MYVCTIAILVEHIHPTHPPPPHSLLIANKVITIQYLYSLCLSAYISYYSEVTIWSLIAVHHPYILAYREHIRGKSQFVLNEISRTRLILARFLSRYNKGTVRSLEIQRRSFGSRAYSTCELSANKLASN